MSMETTDIADFIIALKESGGIPISMSAVTQADPNQFAISTAIAIIGSAIIIWWCWELFIKQAVSGAYARLLMFTLTRNTGRRYILIKHTEVGLFNQAMIDSHTLQRVEQAIMSFRGQPFDLILHTPGGSIFFTQILSRIIKDHGGIRCFIPYYAMSGGTMLALNCSEIYMGRMASMGAVDPQLGSMFSIGSAKSWEEVVRVKQRRASDTAIQMDFMGRQYTKTIKQNIISALSDKIPDAAQLDKCAEFLTNGGIEHAYQLSIPEAQSLGIPVREMPADIQATLSKVVSSSFLEGVYYG